MSLSQCTNNIEAIYFWFVLVSTVCLFASFWFTLGNVDKGNWKDGIAELALGPIYFYFVSDEAFTKRGRVWRKLYVVTSLILLVNISIILITDICQ